MGGLLALIPRISEIIGEILAQPLKPGAVDRSARRTKREALQNPQRKSENLLNPRPESLKQRDELPETNSCTVRPPSHRSRCERASLWAGLLKLNE
jgi:hypothetical protein